MHVIFDTESVSLVDFSQAGAGYSYFEGVTPYQRGWGRQRGNGVGAILKSLYRFLLPLAKTAGKSVGKEGLATAGRIFTNLADGNPFKDTVTSEARAGVNNLIERITKSRRNEQTQSGMGIKRKRKKRNLMQATIIPSKIIKRKRIDAFGLY